MKSFRFLVLILIMLSGCGYFQDAPSTPEPWYPAVNAKGDPVFAVFESRLPCPDCQRIKFALALYADADTHAPASYQLARVYVGKSPEERIVNEGEWVIARGTKLDPQSLVYQLDANVPPEFQFYWVMDENILFILDQAMQPRVGDASGSYALNRTH